MHVTRRIRKFLQASRTEKLIFIQALFALAAVTIGLRIFPWLKVQTFLRKQANQRVRLMKTTRLSVSSIGWAVRAASRVFPNATCLPQALVAEYFLVGNGYPAHLQIGVARKKTGALEAHAWVTSDDQVIVGNLRDLDGFVPLSKNQEAYVKVF